jgi:cyclopropane fatty-acyl-phospholipid synthase-like methyltransferase
MMLRFQVFKDLLIENGLIMLQSIGTPQTNAKIYSWIDTYIFRKEDCRLLSNCSGALNVL